MFLKVPRINFKMDLLGETLKILSKKWLYFFLALTGAEILLVLLANCCTVVTHVVTRGGYARSY